MQSIVEREGRAYAILAIDVDGLKGLNAPRSEIDVIAAGDPTRKSTGVGEVGTVPVAAAIANAVFAACGARVRELPITAAKVRAAMATTTASQAATSG